MTEGLLYHEVSEKERKDIEKQAKHILDVFAKEISKIEIKDKGGIIERDNGDREEKEKDFEENEISREIMFENAPNKNKNSIIAEKKKW